MLHRRKRRYAPQWGSPHTSQVGVLPHRLNRHDLSKEPAALAPATLRRPKGSTGGEGPGHPRPSMAWGRAIDYGHLTVVWEPGENKKTPPTLEGSAGFL